MSTKRTPFWAKPNRLPNIGTLRRVFRYDAQSGRLFWAFRAEMGYVWNADFVGYEAGYTRRDGYRIVTLNGKRFLVHRLIWKIIHGVSPKQVDHINGNGSDNRPSNLRSVTHHQNRVNLKMRTGRDLPRGVTRAKDSNRFLAQITANGKHEYLGCFKTPDEASAAYQNRASPVFGKYRRAV